MSGRGSSVPITHVPPPAVPDVFVCAELRADLDAGHVEFDYRLGTLLFTEQLDLPAPPALPDDRRAAVLDVLRLLHVVAGVSYFKTTAPDAVQAGSALTAAEAEFVQAVYRQGLREFAYVNDLPRVLSTEILADRAADRALDPSGDLRPLVPCGGGKDSIVSAELLRDAGREPVSFAVNPNQIIEDVVTAAGLPMLRARRRIDPQLFDLNSSGAFNGHIPVTAVNSLIAVATAVLHGLGPVVMSNESSASSPNLDWHGVEVNHQWSKSLAAEELLQAALASRLGRRVRYFSLLRQLNEIQIAGLFARTSGYDDCVTSCNRAFTILKTSGRRWCRDCPKCRFVFLAMAPYMDSDRVEHIFGGSMFADPDQMTGYHELLGIGAFKPFECVGEIDESFATVRHLAEQDHWKNQPIIEALMRDISRDGRPLPSWDAVRQQRAVTAAPAEYVDLVDAAL